jgi:hypothetical protein
MSYVLCLMSYVYRQRENGSGWGVLEWDGGHERCFHLGEGGVRGRQPQERFGCAPEEVR